MKKKTISALGAALLLTTGVAWSDSGCEVKGVASQSAGSFVGYGDCYNTSFNSVSVDGVMTFGDKDDPVKVVGDFVATGDAMLDNSQVDGNVVSNGSFLVRGGSIVGRGPANTVTIRGNLDVEDSTINSSLDLSFSPDQGFLFGAAIFNNGTVGQVNAPSNIIVEAEGSCSAHQVLMLEGNSVIHGNITFKSGCGIIKKSKHASITGTVTGATIVPV